MKYITWNTACYIEHLKFYLNQIEYHMIYDILFQSHEISFEVLSVTLKYFIEKLAHHMIMKKIIKWMSHFTDQWIIRFSRHYDSLSYFNENAEALLKHSCSEYHINDKLTHTLCVSSGDWCSVTGTPARTSCWGTLIANEDSRSMQISLAGLGKLVLSKLSTETGKHEGTSEQLTWMFNKHN